MATEIRRDLNWEKAILSVLEAQMRPKTSGTWCSWEQDEQTDEPILQLQFEIGEENLPLSCDLSFMRVRPDTYQLLFYSVLAEDVQEQLYADVCRAAMEVNYISLFGDFGVSDSKKLYFKYAAMLDQKKDIPELIEEITLLFDIHISSLLNVFPLLYGIAEGLVTLAEIEEKGGVRAIMRLGNEQMP